MTDDIPSDPITGICIVADPYKCPPRYDLLYKSWDRKDDCDLWKDGLFRSKITRYICITRAANETGHPNEVLADFVIQNEKEYPPPGYQLIERTKDTCDKATNKKQICVKLVERRLATDGISDLIILSRNKRAPSGYAMAGEINGLVICFRLCTITNQDTETVSQSQQLNAAPPVMNGNANGGSSYFENHLASMTVTTPAYTRQDSTGNALSGVPFNLNPRLVDSGSISAMMGSGGLGSLVIKSSEEIENEMKNRWTEVEASDSHSHAFFNKLSDRHYKYSESRATCRRHSDLQCTEERRGFIVVPFQSQF